MPASLFIFISEKAVQRVPSSADVFIQNGIDHIHFNIHIWQEISYISSARPLLFPSLTDNSFLRIIMLVSRDIYIAKEMNKHPTPALVESLQINQGSERLPCLPAVFISLPGATSLSLWFLLQDGNTWPPPLQHHSRWAWNDHHCVGVDELFKDKRHKNGGMQSRHLCREWWIFLV